MNLLAFAMPGLPEMIIIGIIAVLLFGKRLPGVAKSLGQSIMSFKKGFKEVEQEVNDMGQITEDAGTEFKTQVREVERELKA